MKKTKTILSLVLAAALLVTATVATTIAYLTDTTAVVNNTFSVGKVDITLDETDIDGSKTGVEPGITESGRDKANSYKIIPGSTYTKDPRITVLTGSENCYVFVKVENGLADVLDENGIDIDETKWTEVKTGVYLYKEVLSAGGKAIVFREFTVDGDVSDSDYNAAKDAEIVVTAYAIQAEGFDAKDEDDVTAMMTALGL